MWHNFLSISNSREKAEVLDEKILFWRRTTRVLVYKEKKKKGAPTLLNQSEESTTCKTGRLVPTLFAYEP
jgi:hypothetical protein